MSDGWITMGPEEQERAHAIITTARASLAAAGFPVRNKRFPFAMHHDVYRVRLPRGHDGARLRHTDVARLLNAWAVGRRDPEDYAWQALAGAIREMAGKEPHLAAKVPEDIWKGIDGVGAGSEFLDWASGEVSRGF